MPPNSAATWSMSPSTEARSVRSAPTVMARATGGADLVGELDGPRLLVAEVDDDVRAGGGEQAHGVGADAAGRSRHDSGLPGERSGGEGVGHW